MTRRFIDAAIDALLIRCETSVVWFTGTTAAVAFVIFAIGYGIVAWIRS